MQVHQTVEGSLLKFVARNHWKSVHLTLNGTAFGWKNYSFSPKEAPLKPSKKSLEICSLHTPNGRRLSFENPLESLKSVHFGNFLKSVHFVHFS